MNLAHLARPAGAPIDPGRYSPRQQLLPTAARSAGGYRIFGEPDLRRLRFIRRAKALGFSLDEIGELLALSDRHSQDMGSVRDTAQARLQDIAQRMAELQRMHTALSQLVDACPGHGALDQCPILAALTGDNA
ncbi:hypothetical protein G6F24_017301 [Rhizopus arrhizus]|nr:hypothetical protein G6F24_017301 [Rhizopus arrhizus]